MNKETNTTKALLQASTFQKHYPLILQNSISTRFVSLSIIPEMRRTEEVLNEKFVQTQATKFGSAFPNLMVLRPRQFFLCLFNNATAV
jgi:hypothetical protein